MWAVVRTVVRTVVWFIHRSGAICEGLSTIFFRLGRYTNRLRKICKIAGVNFFFRTMESFWLHSLLIVLQISYEPESFTKRKKTLFLS